ncbi:MAG: sugar kinase [Lentisphaeria bacterium]|nr:sugar kinase [Lentisphaeria bacterium]
MEKEIIAGFGEVMLRLTPEGKTRLAQTLPGTLQATFGGGEANVCASLSMLGAKSRYLTALPENPIAAAFASEQRGFGTDVSRIHWTKNGRMGVYYAEHGAAQRGSNVVYDREHSSIAETKPEDYDFPFMLEGCGHLHITGITPALSENAFRSTLAIVECAEKLGIKISCDLNFRKKLWKWKPGTDQKTLAGECMQQIVSHADIIIGNEEDAADVFGIHAENTSIESGKLNISGYGDVARKLSSRFQKASYVAITLRESYSADHNNWGGMLYDCKAGKSFFAPLNPAGEYAPYEIRNIVDRFGGGDSFCAGLIFALRSQEYCKPSDAIAFAVAASCLKHSIHGDYNYSSQAEVVSLMKGNASGRVKR